MPGKEKKEREQSKDRQRKPREREEEREQLDERVVHIRPDCQGAEGRAALRVSSGSLSSAIITARWASASARRVKFPDAVRKASDRARKIMRPIPMIGTTIPHAAIGDFSAARVLLRPASPWYWCYSPAVGYVQCWKPQGFVIS